MDTCPMLRYVLPITKLHANQLLAIFLPKGQLGTRYFQSSLENIQT